MKMKKENILKAGKIIILLSLSVVFVFIMKLIVISVNIILDVIRLPSEDFGIKTLFMGILFIWIIHLLIILVGNIIELITEQLQEFNKFKSKKKRSPVVRRKW